jgi:hypothetical protein
LVILGLLQTHTNAQLFGTGTSIYAKDQVICVKQDLELKDVTSFLLKEMEASYYKEPLIQDPIKDWVIYPFSGRNSK